MGSRHGIAGPGHQAKQQWRERERDSLKNEKSHGRNGQGPTEVPASSITSWDPQKPGEADPKSFCGRRVRMDFRKLHKD